MENRNIRIADIFTTEYADFLEYCSFTNKVYSGDLTAGDFIAFRERFGVGSDRVEKIRQWFAEFEAAYARDVVTVNDSKDSGNNDLNVILNEELNAEDLVWLEDIKKNPDHLFKDIYGDMDFSRYASCSIEVLNPSVRLRNCLQTAKCSTIGDLMPHSITSLMGIRNMGRKSLDRLLLGLRKYFREANAAAGLKETKEILAPVSDNFVVQILNLVQGAPVDTTDLSDSEKEAFKKRQEAAEILGPELCQLSLDKSPYIAMLDDELMCFCRRVKIVKEIEATIQGLQNMWQHPVCYYWLAYQGPKSEVSEDTLTLLATPSLLIKDLPGAILRGVYLPADIIVCTNFVLWLATDFCAKLREIVPEIFAGIQERSATVISERVKGKTLEEIGSAWNITRERIRQLEARGIRAFERKLQNGSFHPIVLICALRGGDVVLRKAELSPYLDGASIDILWHIVSHSGERLKNYHYDLKLDAIIVGEDYIEKISSTDIYKLCSELPYMFLCSDMDRLLMEKVDGNPHLYELLKNEVLSKYKKYGQFYHLGRMSVAEMCDYILKHHFPNGYKTADEDAAKQFYLHLDELFGTINGLPTAHAVDAKMAEVGLLCDRGKYIHPSYITVQPETVQCINDYIAGSSRTVLTYTEILEALSSELKGTPITNRFLLQSALLRYGCPYPTRRDYVTKDGSLNIAEEVAQFITARGKVHKSDLMEEFSYDEIRLGQVVARCPEIIILDNGFFMYSGELTVQENEVEGFRKYIKAACAAAPVSTRSMMDAFYLQFPRFMAENNIQRHGELFGILKYLLKDEFHFSRPFISIVDVGYMTIRSVMLTHMEGIEVIEIGDLLDLGKSVGVAFQSIPIMLDALLPTFVRVDVSTIMRAEKVGITEDTIAQTVEQIENDIETFCFRVAGKVENFDWYPAINVEWTPFLLESVVAMSKRELGCIRIPLGTANLPACIYVGEEFADDDYASFVLKLLLEEHRRVPFTSSKQVLTWMLETGLCYKALPSFLTDGSHLYKDENGIFSVR